MTQKLKLSQLAETVASTTYRPVDVTEEILREAFDELARVLAREGALTITNFGTFSVQEVKLPVHIARKSPIGLTSVKAARFKATGRLREMVRTGNTTLSIKKLPKGSASKNDS